MNSAIIRHGGLLAVLSLASLALANPALAHHAMGGDTPFTLMQGLISGIAHPVIGFDHLAFILGMGAASAFLGTRLVTPLVFVGATLAGCALQLQGIALPIAEVVIAASVVVIGASILSGVVLPNTFYVVLFGAAGLFHGWAYGGSIVGAEQTPLVAYLIGFAGIQAIIAIASMMATRALWQNESAVPLRIAGGAIAGFGLAFLVENLESLVLPGVTA